MAMFKGLESLKARMEEEAPSSEETTVDVEVRVAEEVEEAATVVEEATTIVEDAKASDDAAEEIEALEHYAASIKKHGLTPQGLELMNYKGSLEAFSGRMMPAVEGLDAVGRNHEAAQVALEGIKDSLKKAWDAVVAFFKNIWEKVKAFFAKIKSYLTKWESSVRAAKEALKGIELDPEKVKESKFKLIGKDKLGEMLVSGSTILASINKLSPSQAAGSKTYVKDQLGIKAEQLKVYGMKFNEDGDLVAFDEKEDALEFKETTIGEAGYDVATLEGLYDRITRFLADVRKNEGFVAAFGQLCQAGIKEAQSLSSARDEKVSDETKAKVDNLRAAASSASKLSGKIYGKLGTVFRAYIAACGAVRSCKKGAGYTEKKEEK